MEQDELKHHADILKKMLQDKRKEVEELEVRWKIANRKVRWKIANRKVRGNEGKTK